MCMVVLGIALGQLKAPGAVFSHDGVHQVAFDQPVQYTVQRHPVKRGFLGECVQEFLMGERVFRIKQNIQHRNT